MTIDKQIVLIVIIKKQIDLKAGTFLIRQMQKQLSMSAMLRDHQLTPITFFSAPGIAQQVRGNLNKFTKYFKTHKTFAQKTIALAYNVPYEALDDQNIRNAVHAAIDVLASQESAIAELFLDPEHEDIPEEINGIQNEAQKLFQDDDLPQEEEQERPVELQKGQLLTLSLAVLKEKDPNQTCVGHMQKYDPNLVLKYFQTHPQQKKLLLSSLHFGSISTMVSQLLTCEDKTKQYAYEGLKQQLLTQALQLLFKNLEDEMYFDGAMNLFEEVLNTTKQSYYEYFEDFKRIANILVNTETLGRFRKELNPQKPGAFRNSAKFLQFLFERINSQREDNSYYNRGEQNEPPSMQFQVQMFYDQLPLLIELVSSIAHLSSITKVIYLSFLEGLLTSFRANKHNYSLLHPSFNSLLKVLTHEKSSGVYKGKLYSLVINLLSKASEQEVSEFISAHPTLYNDNFQVIKAANYSNTKSYNKNEAAAFDLSLIDQISKKNSQVFEPASQVIGKDLKRMCKKYETKKFSFQKDNSLNDDSDNEGRSQLPSNFAFNLGGKNNISIPILSLPKGKSENKREEGDNEERRKEREDEKVKQVVEEEEVEVITDKLTKLNLNQEEKSDKKNEETATKENQNRDSSNEVIIKEREEACKETNPTSKEDSISNKQKQQGKDKIKSIGQNSQKARFYAKHLVIYA